MRVYAGTGANLIRPVIEQQQAKAKAGIRRTQEKVDRAQFKGAKAIKAVLSVNVRGSAPTWTSQARSGSLSDVWPNGPVARPAVRARGRVSLHRENQVIGPAVFSLPCSRAVAQKRSPITSSKAKVRAVALRLSVRIRPALNRRS